MSDATRRSEASRARILAKLSGTLAAGRDAKAREGAVRDRLERHARNLVPERGNRDPSGRVALFREQAEAVDATVAEVPRRADVPEAVAAYLRDRNLPARIRHGDDARLTRLPWKNAPTVERARGPAQADDAVSLSQAFTAVAETGTLILTSGPDNPTTLNFLPDNHIVVVEAKDIAGAYEDAWDRIREVYGSGNMPRAVNMVSGPSRTADVAQTIQLGAHGPRSLHVIIVGDA